MPWSAEKNREHNREKYRSDPELYRERQRQTRIRRRQRVLTHYGGVCECCGEDRYEFLSIDHIEGGGTQHRKKVGSNIDRWLIKEGFPEGYRVLCHNCNFAHGLYGACPHQTG